MTSLAITNIDVAAGDKEGSLCVICYAAPVTVQLVHANETSHECVCVGCSDILKARGDPCPVCRAVIVIHLKSNFKSEPDSVKEATPTAEAVLPAAEIEDAEASPLLVWLREHRFAEYTAALDELGVETLDDLIHVAVGDLTAEAVGMKPIQARRFVRLATERFGMGAR